MPPARIFSQVPRSFAQWQDAIQLSGNALHPNQQNTWGSGSNIQKEEHLLLRVLWSVKRKMDANARTDLGLKSQFQNASQWLHRFPPFNTYLQQVRSGKDVPKYDPDTDTDPWGSGEFEVTAREQHRLHLALGSDDYSVPKSHLERLIDEESVNTSLMVFLTALAAKYPLIKGQWTPHQRFFGAEFKPGAPFNAKVDGYYTRKDGSLAILVEAKRSFRRAHEPSVSMQEAAEVVAWLKCDAAVHNRVRYIISQDGPEMYITVASFDNTYLQWLRSKRAISLPNGSFLTMTRYGPWLIQHERDVAEFAGIVLAIMASEK